MLAALNWVCLNSNQSKQAGRCGVDPVSQQLGVLKNRLIWSREGFENRDWNACVRARRVDRKVGRIAQSLDPFPALSPVSKPPRPKLCLLRGILAVREILLLRIVLVYPRLEILASQLRKGQQEVCEISFRVDYD